ncbi:MAG: TIGR02206 family membrane protein [Anaerolineaceae bacterium]|nr:TIGR02206 family membrane protein [Anaerolineaceae bacterium]
MNQFFVKDFTGQPFVIFSPSHLTVLGILLVIILLIYIFRNHFTEKGKKTLRYSLAILLIVQELTNHIWFISAGQWTIQYMLPFHLCAVLVWASAYMLIFKSYRVYEFAYVIGIVGALQAILTPDIGMYGFPHFRFFQTYLSHGSIVIAALYMTWMEGFRPTPKSLLRVLIYGNLYMGLVGIINWLIGSNYLFIANKPPTASLLDALPAWPIYILYIEGLAIVLGLLMYLPFAIKDARAKKSLLVQQT